MKGIPALPREGLRGIEAVPAIWPLSLRALFILRTDICLSHDAHALPSSVNAGTINKTGDSWDKDFQRGRAMLLRLGERGRGLWGRDYYNVTVQ